MTLDLTNRISHFGTYCTRGMEAVQVLRQLGENYGTFEHNGMRLEVYSDSTEREIAWQHACLYQTKYGRNNQ